MSSYTTISVVVADDHEIFRQGFKTMIGRYDELEVVGEAENGKELVQLVASLQPDLAFVDIKMPLMDGIDATREIASLSTGTRVIALSMFSDDVYVIDMLQAGASGYVLKNAHYDELVKASRIVMSGGYYFCNDASEKIQSFLKIHALNSLTKVQDPVLTDREIQIIQLICEQLTTKEIAANLGLSQRTVDTYRDVIQKKTNSKNMAGVVLYAVKYGLYKG
ncbi:MAG: DNA-binding response regulator [Chitinophagales bacterium]|nr:DNA-binding response regulator [Chitinophagales bacterium]